MRENLKRKDNKEQDMIIDVKVSLDDLEKIKKLDEFNILESRLQTSAAQYIQFSIQPEIIKREDIKNPYKE